MQQRLLGARFPKSLLRPVKDRSAETRYCVIYAMQRQNKLPSTVYSVGFGDMIKVSKKALPPFEAANVSLFLT